MQNVMDPVAKFTPLTCIECQSWSVEDHPHINDLQKRRRAGQDDSETELNSELTDSRVRLKTAVKHSGTLKVSSKIPLQTDGSNLGIV